MLFDIEAADVWKIENMDIKMCISGKQTDFYCRYKPKRWRKETEPSGTENELDDSVKFYGEADLLDIII